MEDASDSQSREVQEMPPRPSFLTTLTERWSGKTWEIQSTRSLPGAYDIDPPAVACPWLSSCTAVGGYTHDGPKLNLAEHWSPTHQANTLLTPARSDQGDTGYLIYARGGLAARLWRTDWGGPTETATDLTGGLR